jgi:hypothetical protein
MHSAPWRPCAGVWGPRTSPPPQHCAYFLENRVLDNLVLFRGPPDPINHLKYHPQRCHDVFTCVCPS